MTLMDAGAFNKALFSFDKNNENLPPGNDLDISPEEGLYLIFLTSCAVENNAARKKIGTKPQILFQ